MQDCFPAWVYWLKEMKSMKRWFWLLAVALTLISCEKESTDPTDPFEAFLSKPSYSPKPGKIWDFMPTEFHFVVTDAQGNNLFDESTPDNWLSKPFSATFEGQKFLWPSTATKHYLAILKGFYIYPKSYTQSAEVLLRFGELDSTKKWDTDLIVTWPDGSRDVIRVQHAFRWDISGDPEIYTGFKVNGVPIEGTLIRLTK